MKLNSHQVRLDQALKLQKRLVVERDEVDLAKTDAALAQAIGQRLAREARIVALAAEAHERRQTIEEAELHSRQPRARLEEHIIGTVMRLVRWCAWFG